MRTPCLIASVFAALFATGTLMNAEAQEKKPDLEKLEAGFIAMLKDATLHGTWAPISQQGLGEDKADAYRVVRAVKKSGNQWEIVSRVNRKGREFEFPIPVVIEFAGDAAVMILEEVPLEQGKTWSARILFHDNVYAGSWWSPDGEKSGIVSGTITQGDSE